VATSWSGEASEGAWYDDIRFELLSSLVSRNRPRRVLDVECGTGGLAVRMAQRSPHCAVIRYDPAFTKADCDRLGGARILPVATLDEIPGEPFQIALLMDVLEYVDRPEDLLVECAGREATNGRLVVTVPANRWLWSSHDEALGRLDRYTIKRL
jgi:2-polyprenyl-3-methyl-5-hydroxy-6-metoxy-1,4-benzoquinol methylase